jgi:hypothetical protein
LSIAEFLDTTKLAKLGRVKGPKRSGRPPTPAALRRTERLTLNFTPGERRRLAKRAGAQSLSDYLRDLVLAKELR